MDTPDNAISGRIAIVTGATSGIGRGVCEALIKEGAKVVAVGRNPERLAEIERVLNAHGECLALRLDVTDEADMRSMASETLARFGRIDILIASAGIARAPSRKVPVGLSNLPADEWDAVIATNLHGLFLSNRAVLPAMIEQRRGDIINVSSFPAGITGQAFAASYSASKFGVIGASEALQEEVRAYGIRVQTLLPGPTDTAIFGESASKRFGPLMPVEHVAETVLHLLNLPFDTTLGSVIVKAVGG